MLNYKLIHSQRSQSVIHSERGNTSEIVPSPSPARHPDNSVISTASLHQISAPASQSQRPKHVSNKRVVVFKKAQAEQVKQSSGTQSSSLLPSRIEP